jgi:hypothetical protein
MVDHGARLERVDYAVFSPGALLESPTVSNHMKDLIRELSGRSWF